MARRCELLSVARSSMYYKKSQENTDDVIIMNEIDNIYQEIPIYGYRRITVELRYRGFVVNHKKVQRLMQQIGRKAIYPKKKTTRRNPDHKVFPYLLRGLKIDKPNQVWQVDITYIYVNGGFIYLVCLIDVFSRKIMGWALSIFLETMSCLEALNNALMYSKPDIVNSDQGCQFTSAAWTDVMKVHGILISMDGKGRWADNVYVERLWRSIKQEAVCLYRFDTVEQARSAISKYIDFYNQKRFHQKLNYHTPNMVYTLGYIPTKQELFKQFLLVNHVEQEGTFMDS